MNGFPVAASQAIHDRIQDYIVPAEKIGGLLMNKRNHFDAVVVSGVQNGGPVFPGCRGKQQGGKQQTGDG